MLRLIAFSFLFAASAAWAKSNDLETSQTVRALCAATDASCLTQLQMQAEEAGLKDLERQCFYMEGFLTGKSCAVACEPEALPVSAAEVSVTCSSYCTAHCHTRY